MRNEPRFGSGLRQSNWIQRYVRRSNFKQSDFNQRQNMEASDWYFIWATLVILFVWWLL